MPYKLIRALFGLTLLGALTVPTGDVHAQPLDEAAAREAARTTPIPLTRLTGSITIDGVPDEAAWEAVDPLPLTTFQPIFKAPASQRTEIRLLYDDEYVYVAGRMYDSDPANVRTNTLYRDVYSGDDIMAVIFDSFNDYETGLWFVVNPAGARNDMALANDAEFAGGQPMNPDWNSHWDAETTVTDEGWFAELRIPFSTLKFQVVDDEVVMGLIAYRFIPRLNERQMYPEIPPDWGGFSFAKVSRSQRVSLSGVRQPRPVYVTPYGLGGYSQIPLEREGGAGWITDRDPTSEVGVDLKFAPTTNLTVDLSMNTDFAQVEADQQQINLTRFPLFFPEKRQFFQERSSTFDFGTGGFLNRLFHSRRIGLDSGDRVRIYGGGRAVGRIGSTDVGFLSMQTAAPVGGSSENVGVLRLSQQVFNPNSAIGGMVTSRLGDHGEDNIAYGLDGLFRFWGDEYVGVKWAQTFDEATDEESALSSGLFLATWERRRDAGWSYSTAYSRVGADYRPGLGFQLRRDYSSGFGDLQYTSYRDDDSPFRNLGAGVNTEHFFRNEDQSAESRSYAARLTAEFKGGANIRLFGRALYESIEDAFTISDLEIPEGNFWFDEAQLRFELPRSRQVRGDVGLVGGSFYDGSRIGFSFNPTWNASKHVELMGGYELNRLDFSDRGQEATSHLVRLRVQLALDTRLSLSTFAQYNSLTELSSFNARFRYHFREGTDLWLVYNEGRFASLERAGLDPLRPALAGRSFMIKYSHALIL